MNQQNVTFLQPPYCFTMVVTSYSFSAIRIAPENAGDPPGAVVGDRVFA